MPFVKFDDCITPKIPEPARINSFIVDPNNQTAVEICRKEMILEFYLSN